MSNKEQLRPTILHIEDDFYSRELTQSALRLHGLDVDYKAASTSEEAIKIARKSIDNLTLLLIDIHLPGDHDGIAAAAAITAIESLANTPIIFFTADNTFETRLIAQRLKPLDYITKPGDLKDLAEKINQSITSQDNS